jgi:hypothetical protein
MKQHFDLLLLISPRDRGRGVFWSACPQGHVSTCSSVFPPERSGEIAFAQVVITPEALSPKSSEVRSYLKRRGAPLPAALQNTGLFANGPVATTPSPGCPTLWSAPAERSGDGALAWGHSRQREQKRSRASLASAFQSALGRMAFVVYPAACTATRRVGLSNGPA